MTVLLDHEDVTSLLSYETAIDAVEHGFRLDAEGQVGTPERVDVTTTSGWLRLMAVSAPGLGVYGFKAMNLTRDRGVRYGLWIYDVHDGDLLAILDAQAITATRTAAAAAVATKYLTAPDIERVAIIGTGAEARAQLLAMLAVRSPAEVTVFSRTEANRRAFVDAASSAVDVPVRACATLEEALRGAEVVTAATKSSTPVLRPEHLVAGVHVNSIGASRPDQSEIDARAFARADLIVCDAVHHVAAQAGDVRAALDAGLLDRERLHALSDLVAGRLRGRARPDDVTMYKSVGSALQDLALATVVLDQAAAAGIGVDLGDFPYLKPFR